MSTALSQAFLRIAMNAFSSQALPLLRTCRHTNRAIREVTKRAFTLSSEHFRQRAVPSFQESSSSELDDILQTLRTKVVVPGYLNKKQQKLMSGRRFASKLDNDPVYASIGDEEFRLQYLDPQKDIPRTSTLLRQVFELTKDHADWQNWLSILEGLEESRNIPDDLKSKFVRRAIQAGEWNTVMQALKQVERNGLSMRLPEVRRSVFVSSRLYTKERGWTKETLEQAFLFVKQAAELMEHPSHCGSRKVTDRDPRAEPLVLGTLLELAARCASCEGLESYKPLAEGYTGRLLDALQQQDTELKAIDVLKTQSDSSITRSKEEMYEYVRKFIQWLPVWHGLSLVESSGLSFPEERLSAIKITKDSVGELLDLLLSRYKGKKFALPTNGTAAAEWELERDSR